MSGEKIYWICWIGVMLAVMIVQSIIWIIQDNKIYKRMPKGKK